MASELSTKGGVARTICRMEISVRMSSYSSGLMRRFSMLFNAYSWPVMLCFTRNTVPAGRRTGGGVKWKRSCTTAKAPHHEPRALRDCKRAQSGHTEPTKEAPISALVQLHHMGSKPLSGPGCVPTCHAGAQLAALLVHRPDVAVLDYAYQTSPESCGQ